MGNVMIQVSLTALLLVGASSLAMSAEPAITTLISPDGRNVIGLEIGYRPNGVRYFVTRDGAAIIDRSAAV